MKSEQEFKMLRVEAKFKKKYIHTHTHTHTVFSMKSEQEGASLVVQRLRIYLPIQAFESLPGGWVVKNPASAGDKGSISDPGRSHKPRSNKARGQRLLSLCSRAQEPQLRSPHACNDWSLCAQQTPHWEACTPRRQSSRYSPQLERPAQHEDIAGPKTYK